MNATKTTRSITVDRDGRSEIVSVNGDEVDVGQYGENLIAGDAVTLDDGSEWTVKEVYTNIHTGPQTSGQSNYVYVVLVEAE